MVAGGDDAVQDGEGDAAEHRQRGQDEGDRQRPLGGPSGLTATGSADGGIHQPLKPPSTSCGGPRSPAAVDADHESWKPSPSTSQQPSGQPSTVTSRLVRLRSVTVAVGAVACRPVRGGEDQAIDVEPGQPVPGADAIRCMPARASRRLAQRWRRRASPASEVGDRRPDAHGDRSPSMVRRSSRHPVSKSAGTDVRAPIEAR